MPALPGPSQFSSSLNKSAKDFWGGGCCPWKLLVEGLLAYPVGRWIDRGLERRVMVLGSLLAAACLGLHPVVDEALAGLGQAVVPLCLVLIGLTLAQYGLRGHVRGALATAIAWEPLPARPARTSRLFSMRPPSFPLCRTSRRFRRPTSRPLHPGPPVGSIKRTATPCWPRRSTPAETKSSRADCSRGV